MTGEEPTPPRTLKDIFEGLPRPEPEPVDPLDVQRELHDLQHRLNAYHDRLEASLEHDRTFQLKATWGIVNASVGIGAFIGANYVTSHWLHMEGWLLGGIAGTAALFAFGAASAWSDKGREGDEQKLSRLPRWKDSR